MSTKPKKPNVEIKKLNNNYEAKPDSKISFSFQYLTSNKKYNFDFFTDSNFRTKCKAYEDLSQLLKKLSEKTKLELISLSRKSFCGNEKIKAKSLKFLPSGYRFDNDEYVRSFVFGTGDYRLIGIWDNDLPVVLNIIGYDFDHSAYDHG